MNWFMIFIAFILGSVISFILTCCILAGKIADIEMGIWDIEQCSTKKDNPETMDEEV